MRDQYGGEIKIHHRNNEKLTKFGGDLWAAQIKAVISGLRVHLEAKQSKRKQGLGALMRTKYAEGNTMA